ncbi:glycoside-pentoside-hexuronide (GPH):cation symporter [Blautia schinkii]|nr:glycoside-pentoside-hexuronide (GPH):cation symporter [Blautia schinkii]
MGESGGKLSNYLKVSYGLGDLGFIFMVTMSNTYLLMFFTDVAGITAAAAATLMMVGRIIDSCSPPIIGAVIEKNNPRWGKYLSWVLIGAPLIFIFNTLMFSSNKMAMPGKAILACIIYAAFCISTNIAYTGYTSLNSSLTNDAKERVQLSTMRGQGNALGKCLAGFLLLPMIKLIGGGDLNSTGFLWSAVIAGAVCVLLYLNLYHAAKGKDIQYKEGGKKSEKLTVAEMVQLIFSNKNLLLLFVTDVARILAMLVTYAMFPYFFKYVANNIDGAAPFFGIVNILAFIGATSVPFITKFLSKRNAYIAGNLLLSLCMVAAIICSNSVTAVIALISIGYLGYSWGNVVNTSMYADTVDYGEWKTGKNARGLYFSMFQLSIKIAAVFSTAIAGFGLTAVGYVANTEPTEQVIMGIRVISMALPAALLLLGVVLLLFYDLTPKKMDEIHKSLGREEA